LTALFFDRYNARREHQALGYRTLRVVCRVELPSCGGLKSDHPAGGLGETNVKKRNKCLDIAVYNILSLLKSGMYLKCIEKSVQNNEPPLKTNFKGNEKWQK